MNFTQFQQNPSETVTVNQKSIPKLYCARISATEHQDFGLPEYIPYRPSDNVSKNLRHPVFFDFSQKICYNIYRKRDKTILFQKILLGG